LLQQFLTDCRGVSRRSQETGYDTPWQGLDAPAVHAPAALLAVDSKRKQYSPFFNIVCGKVVD
jgi:hypothetical protein